MFKRHGGFCQCRPYGSANDFVRAFGEDAKPAFRDIKKLSQAPSRPMDIIHCGINYALLEVNIGLVGLTTIRANKILRLGNRDWIRSHTPSIYTLSGTRTVLDPGLINQHYNVRIDGRDKSGRYANIHVANCACDGGAFVPSPYSVPDDGELNVIFIHACNRLDMIRMIGDRNKGTFEKHKLFEHHKCKTIEVYSDAPLCIEMDGEGFYAPEIKMEIVPNGIKIFAPEELGFADYSHRAYTKKGRGKMRNER
jgi:diacylglycerol kinase family enzyme